MNTSSRKGCGRQFTIRTLLALMAGFAFIAFVTKWLLSFEPDQHPVRLGLVMIPWAVGSFAGIVTATKRNRSTLVGALVGGIMAATICPGLLFLYAYVNSMADLSVFWRLFAFAACGSGLLAAVVGIVREGVSRSRARV